MKNLANDENTVNGLMENIRCESALNIKKYLSEFFLPKFSLSTSITESIKLGIYPKTVKV
jgi:hypothetical protein